MWNPSTAHLRVWLPGIELLEGEFALFGGDHPVTVPATDISEGIVELALQVARERGLGSEAAIAAVADRQMR